MEADVFSREPNGLIALRITQEEWDELIGALGYVCGTSLRKQDTEMAQRVLRIANRLNAGNPDFIPYEVPAEADRWHGVAS